MLQAGKKEIIFDKPLGLFLDSEEGFAVNGGQKF